MQNIELQNYLHQYIPLSQALGVVVEMANYQNIILRAPLSPNINHQKTVFGGSLYSMATLACWSLVLLNVKPLNVPCEIVIAEGTIKYIAPVKTDFTAHCKLESPTALSQFTHTLQKKPKSRLTLQAHIYQNTTLSAIYSGDFVAIKTG